MKKIPTLFERVFEKHRIVDITDKIAPGCEEAFKHGVATVKIDGCCCAIINGELYKRYDAKKGKNAPGGAIPCCPPDPITGHHPHWVKCNEHNPSDKWFVEAYRNAYEFENIIVNMPAKALKDGTYEATGPHFQGNPYGYNMDSLEPHGEREIEVDRDFESIKRYLEEHDIEGIVFWLNGEPVCKIKRSDFGFSWPVKK